MLRSRKKSTTSLDGDDNGKGDKGGATNERLVSSSTSKPESIVPSWLLWCVVFFFIFLGFASEHYQKSRAADHYHEPAGHHVVSRITLDRSNNVSPSSDKSLLTPQEDEELEYDNGQRYHVIFSTDCSPYQHWQSYLVFFTAMQVRQPGHVTRIVSGCNAEEQEAMMSWFNEKVQFMSKRFHIHLTPKFSEVKDETGKVIGDYKFFNKPYGLKYWLENFELTGFLGSGEFDHADDIVILIDPDMALLRPITKFFQAERETIISPKRKASLLSTEVKRGVPFGQTYGLGTQWQKFDLDKIAGENSPAKKVNRQDGALYFPAGPPYIGTVHDMYQIATKWSEFVPHVHAQYPYLLAEMYAYCIAAAHLNLTTSTD